MPRKYPTLPNLIVIGAMKAGTTSLHHYLSLHPQVFMSDRKELNFFSDSKGRSVEWYKSQFDNRYTVNGEATPQYARYPGYPGVPGRIRDVVGTPKLIYMIRDPINRMVSHYVHSKSREWETRSFDAVVSDQWGGGNDYIPLSSYFFQLKQYLDVFPGELIRVVLLERLHSHPKETLQSIFRFLEIDDEFWSPDSSKRLNTAEDKNPPAPWFRSVAPSALRRQMASPTWMHWRVARELRRLSKIGSKPVEKPKLSPEEDLRLQAVLKPDVDALRQYLGDPLSEWRPYA